MNGGLRKKPPAAEGFDQERNQDFAKGGLENGKFLCRHFDDVFLVTLHVSSIYFCRIS